jgi:hypothetical protein
MAEKSEDRGRREFGKGDVFDTQEFHAREPRNGLFGQSLHSDVEWIFRVVRRYPGSWSSYD